MVSVLCFHLLGPDEDAKEVEPHHTVVLEDGDCIQVENKVRMPQYVRHSQSVSDGVKLYISPALSVSFSGS